jgi:hypothetical protein
MAFDPSKEYSEHRSDTSPVEYSQNGVTATDIPEGFKKGRFGRLEPIT